MILTVDTGNVVRKGADSFIGINLNYIRDEDANRPKARPLVDALKQLNGRWLRYPGGEKSDFYSWAQPPYDKPSAQSIGEYADYPGARMDFDAYMKVVQSTAAEPYVVVGYDSLKRTGVTKEDWIKSAAGLVRYANIVRKYNVRYWEVGNENWHNGTATPTEMAGIVREFSEAMKAVDPSIMVGSSGSDKKWWSAFLPAAAPHLDFVSLSLYNCYNWKSYTYFPQNLRSDTIAQVHEALESIERFAPPADRARLKVVVAETNSKDYTDNWKDKNNLGHALVVFDTFGRLMKEGKVQAAMLWTTRWINDAEATQCQWYALDKDNGVLPVGMGIELWGRFILPEMIQVRGEKESIVAYACRSSDEKRVTLWLLNASTSATSTVEVRLNSSTTFTGIKAFRFGGNSPDDEAPALQAVSAPLLKDQTIPSVVCGPISITILQIE
ncbi:hypothetical protein DB346_15660 [Verrucomicrobia bacterium LW23]|nr:hypothetical protein DB346_15660 [Verrucomicrobia bacterium LW23]